MRRPGLTAAGLLVGVALLAGGCGAQARLVHTCSATDRQFISTAQLNIASLGLWADDYRQGDARAADVVDQAHAAAATVRATAPRDPSLRETRALLNAMFNEYARAVQAHAHNGDAAPHLVRAYGLASFAHDVLVEAEPALQRDGCDIRPLL